MRASQFNQWLSERIEFQTKIIIGGITGMVAIGLVLFVIQGGLMFLLLKWGYGLGVALLSVAAIFGGMGYFTYLTAPKTHKDSRHKLLLNGEKVRISLAPTIANAWTFAFGSLDSDQSILERIFGMLMIVPRMFWTGRYLFQRIEDVKAIDVESCGKVLRMVLKKAERVNVVEIADKFSKMDILAIMRQLSLIEGVVFLTKESVGITLANRFKDDLEKWMDSHAATAGDDDPDEVTTLE